MDPLLVIGGLVVLTWGAVIWVRGGLVAGALCVLLAGVCFGHPFFHLPSDPIPVTADRLLWLALLGQYVLWRRWGLADPKPMAPADWTLLALLGILTLSALSHGWPSDDPKPISRLLFYYLMPAGIYWVVRQARLSEPVIRGLWATLLVFGLYLAFTAVAEVHRWDWAVFPPYIASPRIPEFLGRARGPLLNPVGSGLLTGVCLVATLMWWPRLGRWGRTLLLAVAMALGAAVYYSLTRSVWMGAALALAVLLGAAMPRTWRVPALAGALVLVAVLAATHWDRLMAFKRDKGLSAQEAAGSVQLRPILAAVAWRMFLDHPVLGCGLGRYEQAKKPYLADRSMSYALEKARPYAQHSVFLSLLTETGLAGLGAFVALLVFWTRDAWRLWRSRAAPPWVRHQGLLMLATLGMYLPNGMFHDVSIIPMLNMVLFFLAGVTAGLRAYAQCSPEAAVAKAAQARFSPGHTLDTEPLLRP